MNNHPIPSTTDFRYLDVTHPAHRYQIERGLEAMGTRPEVIFWFWTQLDELKADYTEQLKQYDNDQIDA